MRGGGVEIAARYELFLRGKEPDEDVSRLTDEVRVGEAVTVELFEPEEGRAGLDLAVTLEEPSGGRKLADRAFELARIHHLTVYDPQLGREVGEQDTDAIDERYEQTATFSRGGFTSADPLEKSAASTRLWLIIGGLIVLSLVVMRLLRCSI